MPRCDCPEIKNTVSSQVNSSEQTESHSQLLSAHTCETRANLEGPPSLGPGRQHVTCSFGQRPAEQTRSPPCSPFPTSADTQPGDQASPGLGTRMRTAGVPSRDTEGEHDLCTSSHWGLALLPPHDAAWLTDQSDGLPSFRDRKTCAL